MKKRNKKATLLVENIVFIVLNLLFLTILILFIHSQVSNTAMMEKAYSKQIALMIDAAQPGMKIILDMEDAFDKAEGKNFPEVIIEENIVTVRLESGTGNSYSFFNNVDVIAHESIDSNKYYFEIKENE